MLGDLNAVVGSSRVVIETVVGPHSSGVRTDNVSKFMDFTRGHSLTVAGTWYQRPDHHRWTWYSNTATDMFEVDHVLFGKSWRLLRNCRVFRSAQFDTDHRLLVTELQIRIRPTSTVLVPWTLGV